MRRFVKRPTKTASRIEDRGKLTQNAAINARNAPRREVLAFLIREAQKTEPALALRHQRVSVGGP